MVPAHREVAAEPAAERQAADDQVGLTLDGLVDDRRAHVARLEQDGLELVARGLGGRLRDVEHALRALVAARDVGVERERPVDLHDVDAERARRGRPLRSSAARETICRSVRPPDSATTARRNCGVEVSPTFAWSLRYEWNRGAAGGCCASAGRPPGHDTTGPAGGRTRVAAAPTAGAAPDRSGLLAVLAPAIGDVRDHRVLAAHERRLEALRRLVVEQPVPPVAGDVLGQHDDRRRRLLVRRPGALEHVEVRDERARRARGTATRPRRAARPAAGAPSARRSASASSRSVVMNTAWSIDGSATSDLPNMTACTTERLMPFTGITTRCLRCGRSNTMSSRTSELLGLRRRTGGG